MPTVGMETDNAVRVAFSAEGTWTSSSTPGRMSISVNDGSTEWNGGAFKGLVMSGSAKTVLVNTETDLSSTFGVQTSAAGDIGAVIRGAASQTASLQEWQSSAGNPLLLVDSGGMLTGGTGTTSDLYLKTTTGVGTTGADMHFLVGNKVGKNDAVLANRSRSFIAGGFNCKDATSSNRCGMKTCAVLIVGDCFQYAVSFSLV